VRFADFALGGRVNAFAVAALLGFVPFFSWTAAAFAALVILRKGTVEGGWALLGAVIPAGVQWQGGDPSLCGVLASACAGAIVLRTNRNLAGALITVSLASAMVLFLIQLFAQGQLALLANTIEYSYQQLLGDQMLSEMKVSFEQSGTTINWGDLAVQATALTMCWLGVLSLMLARWFQARLFNPGGFRLEVHALRLSQVTGFLLAALFVLVSSWEPLAAFMPMVLMPIVLAGIGLVHGLVGLKKSGMTPLVVFYLGLVLFGPLMVPILAVAVVLDSFFDFRGRVRRPQ